MLRTFVSAIVAAFLALLLGCGPAMRTPVESFRHQDSGGIKRAAFELQCPESELEVTDLGGWTIGVSGCGKRAIYKGVAGAGWVNNSGVEDPKGSPQNHPQTSP